MGGMDGFGAIECLPNEKVFHAAWEGRVLAMSRALGGLQEWNIDIGRYWIELLAPDVYLASSYYARWLARLENLLVALDLVSKAELVAGHAGGPGRAVEGRALTLAEIDGTLIPGSFQDWRPRAGAKHSSAHPHKAAALCARAFRRD
jgi:nitrile hydratase